MSETLAADVRLREAFTALAERAEPGAECPEPELLWSAIAGEAARGELDHVLRHVAGCGACTEAWRLARELRESLGLASAARAQRLEPASAGWWTGWAKLAAGLVAAALVVGVPLVLDSPETSYRDAAPGVIQSRIAEDSPLPRSACVLRWSAGPPGSRYSIHVTTPELETLARARGLETAEFPVPETALEALPQGARILWQVEAAYPDGTRVTSPTFVSRIE